MVTQLVVACQLCDEIVGVCVVKQVILVVAGGQIRAIWWCDKMTSSAVGGLNYDMFLNCVYVCVGMCMCRYWSSKHWRCMRNEAASNRE
jgi:hypothetical protein